MSTFASRRVPVLAAALLAVTALAACGTTTSLRSPVIPKVTAKFNSTAINSTTTRPTRPQRLDLAGEQPCDLLPQRDWPAFFVEKQGEQRENEAFGGPECFYKTNVGMFDIHLSSTEGIEFWLTAETAERIEYTDPVKGFPALVRAESRDKHRCDIIVDVADGQYLRAVASIDSRSESKLPPKCETAHRLAEIAVTTLLA